MSNENIQVLNNENLYFLPFPIDMSIFSRILQEVLRGNTSLLIIEQAPVQGGVREQVAWTGPLGRVARLGCPKPRPRAKQMGDQQSRQTRQARCSADTM